MKVCSLRFASKNFGARKNSNEFGSSLADAVFDMFTYILSPLVWDAVKKVFLFKAAEAASIED